MPKHLGGNNDPDNLVEVTIEEHAEIHRCLWLYGGRWQDEIAWRMLSGQINSDQARRMAVSRANTGRVPWHKGTKGLLVSTRKGIKRPLEQVKKGVEKTSRWWRIIDPQGVSYIIKNMSKFCIDNNLDRPNMSRVAKGQRLHHKNWKCEKL